MLRKPVTQKPDGCQEVSQSPIEAVLNWQSKNALTQNKMLCKIAKQTERIEDQLQKTLLIIDQTII